MECKISTAGLVALLFTLLLGACSEVVKKGDPRIDLQEGWSDFRSSDYSLAIEKFEAVLAETPEGVSLRGDALYGLGCVWALRRPGEDLDKARSYDQQLLQQFPQHPLAPWALLEQARMEQLISADQQPDYPKVRSLYQRVIDQYPDSPATEEAFIYLESTYYIDPQTPEIEASLERIHHFIASHPQSIWRGVAWGLAQRGDQFLQHPDRELDDAIQAYQTSIDPARPKPDYSSTYWQIATLAEFEAGNFTTARDFYHKLLAEFPEDRRCFGAQQALTRMDQLEVSLRSEKTSSEPASK